MARVQTQTRLPFPPINTEFTEAAFLPLTELSSQGWRVPPGCWSEQHTSHMAAYTKSLNREHTLRYWHNYLYHFSPRHTHISVLTGNNWINTEETHWMISYITPKPWTSLVKKRVTAATLPGWTEAQWCFELNANISMRTCSQYHADFSSYPQVSRGGYLGNNLLVTPLLLSITNVSNKVLL